jgi:hypothetical protein
MQKSDEKKRWPRGQRFTLTPEGQAAKQALADAIAAARSATGGRDAQDAVVKAWAGRFNVNAGDGVCLEELANGERNVPEMTEQLLEAGLSKSDIQAAIDRLVSAGLVSPVPRSDGNSTPGTPPSYLR